MKTIKYKHLQKYKNNKNKNNKENKTVTIKHKKSKNLMGGQGNNEVSGTVDLKIATPKLKSIIEENNSTIGKYIALCKISANIIADPTKMNANERATQEEQAQEQSVVDTNLDGMDKALDTIINNPDNCGIIIPTIGETINFTSDNALVANAIAYLVAAGFFASLSGGGYKNKSLKNKNRSNKKGGVKLETTDIELLKKMCFNFASEIVKLDYINTNIKRLLNDTTCNLTEKFKTLFEATNKFANSTETTYNVIITNIEKTSIFASNVSLTTPP